MLVWGLIVGLVAGITLASYLTLISNRYRMATRSMEWNQAIPVLEAGIEEAMAHLHYDSNNLSGNNWTVSSISAGSRLLPRDELFQIAVIFRWLSITDSQPIQRYIQPALYPGRLARVTFRGLSK